MELKLKYKEALAKYKLDESELSKDAKVGILAIKDLVNGISSVEKKGLKVTDRVLNRLTALDKWVYYEILDQAEGTDNNEEEAPETKEVVEDLKKQAQGKAPDAASSEEKPDESQILAGKIDEELAKLFESGKFEYHIDDLQKMAPKTYDVIFDGYEEDDKNGVTTSNFSLIESQPEMFKLSKK